jgi:hypothetical protein
VRDPARGPGHREDGLARARDHARHAGQSGQREVDGGLGQGPAAGLGQHRLGDRVLGGPGRRLAGQVEQGLRAGVGRPALIGVAAAVVEVTEAGDPLAPA